MSSALDDLYQEVVVEHKRKPRHFGTLATATHQARGRNPTCGDDVTVQLQVEDGAVRDIRFNGQGCAICMASSSMMTEAVGVAPYHRARSRCTAINQPTTCRSIPIASFPWSATISA